MKIFLKTLHDGPNAINYNKIPYNTLKYTKITISLNFLALSPKKEDQIMNKTLYGNRAFFLKSPDALMLITCRMSGCRFARQSQT